jgi:hypothetical protein
MAYVVHLVMDRSGLKPWFEPQPMGTTLWFRSTLKEGEAEVSALSGNARHWDHPAPHFNANKVQGMYWLGVVENGTGGVIWVVKKVGGGLVGQNAEIRGIWTLWPLVFYGHKSWGACTGRGWLKMRWEDWSW